MAKKELVFPVQVGALGYATYFISDQSTDKDTIASEGTEELAKASGAVLQNNVSSIDCPHFCSFH